ncbi:MAG: TetM/TetW/TetO/TetS family tetracycline resistance ribosomal protection protein [Lachnospiraceae bacterium]|nr:TetM/TetW/TetO/TetS family tetracycline resistance ribosomal protection protein [Lachnospiraceae bacterium]
MKRKFNIGILAHVDAGKTTITEQLLLTAGAIRRGGSVDDGTTASDFLPVERRRGISVKNACISFDYDGDAIQIIDTPGHADFAGEVMRSLSALDGAVLVLSAVEGVQAQTLTIFRALKTLRIPVILVCNKIDRAGFERDRLEQDIRRQLTKSIAPLDCPDEIFAALAELDPEMEEAFLLEETPEPAVLEEKLALYSKKAEICPLYYTSAKEGRGIHEVLSGIVTYLPDAKMREIPYLSGTVFGVTHDDVMGKVAFVRLYGGKLSARDPVPVYGEPEDPEEALPDEKISQIRRIRGGRYEDTGVMEAGDIAAVCGLSRIRIGDVIGRPDPSRGQDVMRTEPLLLTEVRAAAPEEEQKLYDALRILSEEDPLLALSRNNETGQMFVRIMGTIQTEILAEILATRFGLTASFAKPRVIYREKPAGTAEGFEAYTMPKPCWAIVRLKMEPLPPGSGIQFESIVKEGDLLARYQNHVRQSVYKTLKQGIYGWEVMDTKVTLIDGNSHHVHTHPLDFFVATPVAVLRALTNCGSVLMEPYMRMTLTADESLLGKVMSQVVAMRGEIKDQTAESGLFTMEAVLPFSECIEYPVTFRSLTSGRGVIRMELVSYRPAPPDVRETLPRNGVNPLDRAKWILACRSALSKDLTGR